MTTDGATKAALYRLMVWFSPAYPVGAYAYSHGLEWAIAVGEVKDSPSLKEWLDDVLRFGAGRNDAILLAAAWRAVDSNDAAALEVVADLARALAPSAERYLETTAQGSAFAAAARAAWPCAALEYLAAGGEPAYPVAVGVVAAGHTVPLALAIQAYLQAFAANLVSAGVRLIPLGQSEGLRLVAALEPLILRLTEEACAAGLDDIGGAAFLADIASMKHETQYTRLFRS
jgi:urease accessory protein